MSEQPQQKQTSDPHGGISASGTTADEMGAEAHDDDLVNDYGNTGQETARAADEAGDADR